MSATLPRNSRRTAEMEIEPELIVELNQSDVESLISTNVPDSLENEQTWPTEEEMNGQSTENHSEPPLPDAKTGTTPRRVKRVPKGWSDYQAAWIIEDEDLDGHEGNANDNTNNIDEADIDTEMMSEREAVDLEDDDDEMQELPETDDPSRKRVAFQDLDMEEESRQCVVCVYTHFHFVLTHIIYQT